MPGRRQHSGVRGTVNLYIVEDDAVIRRSLHQLLESADYHVRSFASGKQLLKGLREQRPDALILDWCLPDVTGMDLLDRISQRGPMPFPVIVVSGCGDIPTAVAAIKRGVFDFLEKPFRPSALLDVVAQAMAQRRPARRRRRA